jgi:hypothetical protein
MRGRTSSAAIHRSGGLRAAVIAAQVRLVPSPVPRWSGATKTLVTSAA